MLPFPPENATIFGNVAGTTSLTYETNYSASFASSKAFRISPILHSKRLSCASYDVWPNLCMPDSSEAQLVAFGKNLSRSA